MDFRLTEEQQMFRQVTRDLAQQVFKDKAERWDRNEEVPWENIRLLAEKGYMGIMVPEEYGGAGGNLLDLVIVLEEVAAACVNTALYIFGANSNSYRIMQLGTDEQKETYVPRIARGEIIPAHAMSESHAGSDANAIQTYAVPDGDDYIINGTKTWISRGAVADVFLVNVRFGREPKAPKGLILVEKGTPGFEIGRVLPLMGHRGSPSTELVFQDCRVPQRNRMAAGDFKASLMAMSLSRCCNGAMALGAAQRAFDEAVAYIQEREAYGLRLADFQGLRWMVADMKVKLEAARLLLYRAAANSAGGYPSIEEAAVAKTFTNEAALQVISDAMQLMGANGYSREFPLERLYRDARAFAIAGGTTQVQRNLIARGVLGRRRYS